MRLKSQKIFGDPEKDPFGRGVRLTEWVVQIHCAEYTLGKWDRIVLDHDGIWHWEHDQLMWDENLLPIYDPDSIDFCTPNPNLYTTVVIEEGYSLYCSYLEEDDQSRCWYKFYPDVKRLVRDCDRYFKDRKLLMVSIEGVQSNHLSFPLYDFSRCAFKHQRKFQAYL